MTDNENKFWKHYITLQREAAALDPDDLEEQAHNILYFMSIFTAKSFTNKERKALPSLSYTDILKDLNKQEYQKVKRKLAP